MLVWFGLLRVVPYNMFSLTTVYLGRAHSVMILFVLITVSESGSPLDTGVQYSPILHTASWTLMHVEHGS